MKSAVFDIETTALEAIGAGIMLCACVRPLATKRTRTFRVKYQKEWKQEETGFLEVEETEMLKEFIAELSTYDLLIGHNIEMFDLPFIRTRAYRRGLDCDLMPFVYDTMRLFGRTKFRTVNNGFGKPTKSLDMIADLLQLDQLKTKIYPASHWMTIWGNAAKREEAMKDIIDHCERDVRMNMGVYEMLMPYDYKGIIRRWM
jgi:DNA polymerase elongation subunit (family B)